MKIMLSTWSAQFGLSNLRAGQNSQPYNSFISNPMNLNQDTFLKSKVSFCAKKDFTLSGDELLSSSSPLEKRRLATPHEFPPILANISKLSAVVGDTVSQSFDTEQVGKAFPFTFNNPVLTFSVGEKVIESPKRKVGIILSGGPAPGGHNVIAGLFDALKELNPENELLGFVGGPDGLLSGKHRVLTKDVIDKYRNTGGFDMIVSGRTKLETEEHFEKVLATCKKLGLSSIVIAGGDDSNTNSALLAEWLKKKGEDIQVIGCPKTLDGDLKNKFIESPFGFETATREYANRVSNICSEAASMGRDWHFVRIMGRSASNVALEVSLQTHPNITLISEEIEANNKTLDEVVTDIAQKIAQRSSNGKNYGVALIPEGLFEHIPEFAEEHNGLLKTINDMMKEYGSTYSCQSDSDKLNTANNYLTDLVEMAERDKDKQKIAKALRDKALFDSLPASFKKQVLNLKKDAHGNIDLASIETEKVLIAIVKEKLEAMKLAGKYFGKFSTKSHYAGYEGRAAMPTKFDSDYCYAIGKTSAALINSGKTGYMAVVRHLAEGVDKWVPGGAPLASMLNVENRHGEDKFVIKKALVNLRGLAFNSFKLCREKWSFDDCYRRIGAIQYQNESRPLTLLLEQGKISFSRHMLRRMFRV